MERRNERTDSCLPSRDRSINPNLGVAPAPIEAGMAVAWGVWRTRLLEFVDPSVAYPFDMVVRKSLVVVGMSGFQK